MKTLVAAVNRKKTAKSLAVSEKSSTFAPAKSNGALTYGRNTYRSKELMQASLFTRLTVPWMSGLVNGLQNRLRRFESARHLEAKDSLWFIENRRESYFYQLEHPSIGLDFFVKG